MRNEEAVIAALFEAYGAGFDDADADAITALFAYPTVIWQLGGGHVFEDEEDLSENVEALMGVFDDAGIVVTIPEIAWTKADGDSAAALVSWRQEDDAGEAVHEFRCQYTLVRQDGDWRIAAIVNITPEEVPD